jgi:hypothetical protein
VRLDRVEHEPQLRGRLAHVLRDQAVELDAEEGQAQLARERGGGHRLARAGRPDEEELAHRREAVLAERSRWRCSVSTRSRRHGVRR